jgi:hypothetical protein
MQVAANTHTPAEPPPPPRADGALLADGAALQPMPANLPFSRSYWAMPGRLLAGCYPGDIDREEATIKLSGLLRCGVSHIVNLMEEYELDFLGRLFVDYRPLAEELAAQQGRALTCLRRPIPDMSVPSVEAMRGTLDLLDAIIKGGGVVYLHCLAGIGRTGTVVGCHLVRHGLSGSAALARLRELTRHRSDVFWPTPQTAAQREFVLRWLPGQ